MQETKLGSEYETVTLNVRGVTFDNRQKYLALVHANQYNGVRVVQDPDNEYDPNAVRVEVRTADITTRGVGWHLIGFVPKEDAEAVGALIEQGVLIKVKLFVGTWEKGYFARVTLTFNAD